jgi:hypothetical protein
MYQEERRTLSLTRLLRLVTQLFVGIKDLLTIGSAVEVNGIISNGVMLSAHVIPQEQHRLLLNAASDILLAGATTCSWANTIKSCEYAKHELRDERLPDYQSRTPHRAFYILAPFLSPTT